SRTGRLPLDQSSEGHRLQPSLAHAAWPSARRNGAQRRSRPRNRAGEVPRRSGSASAAHGLAWPHCLTTDGRAPSSIVRASAVAGRSAGTRTPSHPTAALRTVLRDTFRSRAISLIVLPLIKCSRRIRPIVSTVSIPPHRSLESERAAHQANLQGVNFG